MKFNRVRILLMRLTPSRRLAHVTRRRRYRRVAFTPESREPRVRPAALRSSYPSVRSHADRPSKPDTLPVHLSIEELRLLLAPPTHPAPPSPQHERAKGKTNNAER